MVSFGATFSVERRRTNCDARRLLAAFDPAVADDSGAGGAEYLTLGGPVRPSSAAVAFRLLRFSD
jgi:hypothetical protein